MNWYLADLVVRIEVAGDPRSVVHVNSCLVEAADADEAFAKAQELGRQYDSVDVNPSGRRVLSRFIGLRDLVAIHEPLEDGSEILWEERVGLSDIEIQRLVSRREQLGVFQTTLPSSGPDYSSAEIMAKVDDILPPRVASIHHAQIMIPPGREAEARRFYGGLLGMTEVEKPAVLRARGGLWMQAGDRQLHIGVETPGVERAATRAHVAYEVTKLEGWRGRLEAAGVEVKEGERVPGLMRFEFRDPFGNRVEFVERVATGGER
jgi:catechol 2,3-dioxygenase-like lactoylglutathione lyase family enzyme